MFGLTLGDGLKLDIVVSSSRRTVGRQDASREQPVLCSWDGAGRRRCAQSKAEVRESGPDPIMLTPVDDAVHWFHLIYILPCSQKDLRWFKGW